MLGDTDAVLGSVPQNASIIQGQKNRQEDAAQGRANAAQAPAQGAGEAGAKQSAINDANSITITPQMAKGLKSVTGQSWDQTVGTKWRGDVFTAVTTGMAQSKYHQDLLNDKDRLESMKEEAGKNKQAQADQDKKTLEDQKASHAKELQDLKEKSAKDLADLKAKHNAESKKSLGGGKDKASTDPQTQGHQLLDAINKAGKSGDHATKKAAVDNYNKFAKEHDLSPYAEGDDLLGELKKGLGKLGSMFSSKSGGEDKQKATDWLKKNHPELKNPTDADIEWAQKKM